MCLFFFFKYTATPEIYTYCHPLSLHAALPILALVARIESLDPAAISFAGGRWMFRHDGQLLPLSMFTAEPPDGRGGDLVLILDDGHRRVAVPVDRKSTRLNSSH